MLFYPLNGIKMVLFAKQPLNGLMTDIFNFQTLPVECTKPCGILEVSASIFVITQTVMQRKPP